MGTVISTNSRSDVTEEYADAVRALIEADHGPLRETTQKNEWGQTDFHVRVHAYTAPEAGDEPWAGEERWAVDYSEPASRELEEYGTLDEAVAEYEELVRAMASNMTEDADGLQVRFDATDVSGVPGPLPELPEITDDQLAELIDSSVTDPVLYAAVDDEGDVVLKIATAAQVPARTAVVTRTAVLAVTQQQDDAEGRATSEDLTDEDREYLRFETYQTWTPLLRGAADVLFTPGPTAGDCA